MKTLLLKNVVEGSTAMSDGATLNKIRQSERRPTKRPIYRYF